MEILELLTYLIMVLLGLLCIWAILTFVVNMISHFFLERKSRLSNPEYVPPVVVEDTISEEKENRRSGLNIGINRRLMKKNRDLKISNEQLKEELKDIKVKKNRLYKELVKNETEFEKKIRDLSDSYEKKYRRQANRIDKLNALNNKSEFRGVYQSEKETHRKAVFFAKLIEEAYSDSELKITNPKTRK